MRELALWDADDGLDRSFGDLETLAARCRFSNCGHAAEPGCAITAAIVAGTLDETRLASWRKLEREARHLERRVDALARAEERRKWKNIGKAVGRHMEMKYGRDDR
jgi:ribosome biogenesis GTPase / thiamine phosphate phosphatase